MTFRPSDDVLEDNENIKQSYPSSGFSNQYNDGNEGDGVHLFKNEENSYNQYTNTDEFYNSPINNIPVEEVKAPDLSELLKNDGKNKADGYKVTMEEKSGYQDNSQETEEIGEKSTEGFESTQESTQSNAPLEIQSNKNTQTSCEIDLKPDNKIQEVKSTTNSEENKNIEQTQESDNSNYADSNNISDTERSSIVSGLEGGINSNLDFLVDNEWFNVVKRYKKMNHLFFRWGVFTFAFIIGTISGIFLNAKAGNLGNANIISDSSIVNKREEKNSDKILSSLIDNGVEIEVKVPYGSALVDGNSFLSKSNLISYKGIILPQTTLIDYNSKNFISMDEFNSQKVNREDIKNLIDFLIVKNSIYRKTANLPNVSDLRWETKTLQGSLIDEFSLGCVNSDKVLDFVCDKFLGIFSQYGKYYDLSKYSSEVLDLVKNLINQDKNIDPICSMINEYILHASITSEDLTEAVNYCDEDDAKFYRKVVDFIDIENSLIQPELSNKVFNDPDLNAYKLLSAQQNVYKILDGSSTNENYINNYLDFVQALINKDKGNNRYLHPIYKDLLYVFNNDELYQKLVKKGKLSSDIKLKIDQINNGNILYGYPSLLSELTVPDIVKEDLYYTGMVVQGKTMDDIFAQYYTMNDRLTIRKVTKISDDKIKVQTEMFTDKIMSATNNETLKLTVVLYRQDNLLYVESIKVANQRKFTDILNIYAADGKVTFYAMMGYIEEQVGMWYEENPEDIEDQPTFCEQIQEMENISLYVCDDESISLYKGDVEYNFQLSNGVLDSFTISDEALEREIKNKLEGVMFLNNETPAIITSIIDFSTETQDDNIEKKLDIFNQFRIHFKLVPDDVHNIEGEPDLFLVDFTLGEFKLQANYNVETHLLTKINYADCSENVEIRNLTISITTENDLQLIEILNNPRIFLTQASPAAYKKHQKICSKDKNTTTEQQ